MDCGSKKKEKKKLSEERVEHLHDLEMDRDYLNSYKKH